MVHQNNKKKKKKTFLAVTDCVNVHEDEQATRHAGNVQRYSIVQ
jgi:hypothetical protein